MSTLTSTYSGSILYKSYLLSTGSVISTTIDTTNYQGAYLFAGVAMPSGSVSLNQGVDIKVKTKLSNARYGDYWTGRALNTAYSAQVNGDTLANATSLPYDGGTGTNFVWGDTLCCWGTGSLDIPTTDGEMTLPSGSEFIRVCDSAVSGSPMSIDAPLLLGKLDNELITVGTCYNNIWLAPGCTYELIFDNSYCHLTTLANNGRALCKSDVVYYVSDTIA